VVLPDAKRKKSTIDGGSGHSRKSSVILPPVAADISDLPSNRQPAVKAVTAKSESVIKSLVKQGTYLLPSGSSANSLAAGLALQIENALIAIHGDPAGYKQQFMAILANIPKNTQLVLQLLEGQLTALEIAEMSSDDMANEDLQRERAKAIEQADKQAILITADGPRVRKTHKGDEIIGGEEVSRVLGSGGGDDASWGTRRARREASDEAMPDADEGSHHGDSEDRPELPDEGDDAPPQLSVDTKPAARKASTNYNMDRAWASAHSPTLATSGNYARVAQAQPPARRDTTMHDADIDRLLKDEASSDEENAREPSPQVGDGSPHAPVWKGRIDMAGVASFAASARWVAGGDVGAKVPGGFGGLLPLKLDITGRIAVARADEYVSGMRWSQSNDVCCLAITPSARRVERENFEKIYRYFSEKGRWGVISGLGDLVRDAYLVTLDKADGAFPGFLEGLDNQTLPREREAEALILTLVVKTKSPHPSPANITASTPTIPAQSPVIPSASANGATLPAATTYPWATPLVLSILGEDVHAPAVVQLFTAVPDMTEEQMRNLKAALVQEPSARMDLGRLGAVLQGNADANGGAGS
ncbi:MAG: hypothetical protein INR71_08400, partial [Terriglobus roseus]|nr:hypothetical protein [Terriglobus roseus]